MLMLALVTFLYLVPAQTPAPANQNPPAPAEAAPGDQTPASPAPSAEQDAKQAFDLVEYKANSRANLKRAIELYEKALASKDGLKPAAQVMALNDLARAHLRYADKLSKKSTRIAEYAKGQTRAQQAQKIDPHNADAMFWEAANGACIGREKGVMNSLWGVSALKKKLQAALKKDPNHHYARETLANVYHELPGLAGGDDAKSEALFKEILRRDPNFTPAKVSYARFLIDEGREDEAKKILIEVRDTKRSSVPADWRKFNKKAATDLLAKLESS